MKLGSIATIRSGLVLSRKQSRESSSFKYRLLNLRSINPDGYIDIEQSDFFRAKETLSPEYLSQSGDVIVRLSAPYTAVLIDTATEGMVISSNFLVIKADRNILIPEYLYWLLNTKQMKHAMFESSSSNMLGAVKSKFFSELEIEPITIEGQQKIATMYMLALRESRLLRELEQLKKQLYDIAIYNMYNEKKRGTSV